MANDPVPYDPRVKAIVERIEGDLAQIRDGKQVTQAINSLEKEWHDLKEIFGTYVWIVKTQA
jgi:hypothetical protein